ncbi:MAG: GerMN domain-containing protein, partial [bacterium]
MKSKLAIIGIFFIAGLLFAAVFSYFTFEPEEAIEEPLAEQEVRLYFLNEKQYHLQEVSRVVPETEHLSGRIEQIVEELKVAPEEERLSTLLPEDLELRSVFFEADVIYIDFNEALIGAAEGSSGEMIFLYS